MAERMTARSHIRHSNIPSAARSGPAAAEKPHLFEKRRQSHHPPEDPRPISSAQIPSADPRQISSAQIPSTPHKHASSAGITPDQIPKYHDKFIGIPEVFGLPIRLSQMSLPGNLFYIFMEDKDAVMVFFYDQTHPKTKQLRPVFQQVSN